MPAKFAVLAALLFATAAQAAVPDGFRRAYMPTAPGSIRVQVSIQRSMPAPASVEDQAKAMEAARKLVYESADRECALLTEVFKGDCRLVNLNVNSSLYERGSSPPMINSNGSATYQLTPHDK